MFKLMPFLLGSALAGSHVFEARPDYLLPTFLPIAAWPSRRHRSPGDRAHKRWKRARASGRR